MTLSSWRLYISTLLHTIINYQEKINWKKSYFWKISLSKLPVFQNHQIWCYSISNQLIFYNSFSIRNLHSCWTCSVSLWAGSMTIRPSTVRHDNSSPKNSGLWQFVLRQFPNIPWKFSPPTRQFIHPIIRLLTIHPFGNLCPTNRPPIMVPPSIWGQFQF